MIKYVDPIPPVIRLLKVAFEGRFNIYGNLFPATVRLPAVLVRQAGGNGSYRIMIISRANDDITAMTNLIEVMNYLVQYGQHMTGIRVKWVSIESQPIPSMDEDSGKPEAWFYLNIEALETD